ncbi:hypothetical protein TNCV_1920911 [Trichonephila clavipes]|nr:hypothetical protein TNCV_1920911 [Trichonephila clavipes]
MYAQRSVDQHLGFLVCGHDHKVVVILIPLCVILSIHRLSPGTTRDSPSMGLIHIKSEETQHLYLGMLWKFKLWGVGMCVILNPLSAAGMYACPAQLVYTHPSKGLRFALCCPV